MGHNKVDRKLLCAECGRKMDGCRAIRANSTHTEVEWCCPKCWRALDMDTFLYTRTREKDLKREVE